jgi:DNA mismatch repair protein MutL
MMDEILANKIAAGEVVERCASVVKELVENSIDAGSTEIKIELTEAGTKEIKITDNGSGMDKEDAALAFGRHATSKLLEEADLYRINTLGFRGEALASIASVSLVDLITSTGDVGTHVTLEGGKVISITAADARKGTIISVKDLFYNTPARLKYMKSLYTELASITEFVNKLALSYPNIKFILINNNSVLLNTDGSGNLLKTIKSIYGIDVTKKMIPVTTSDDDYEVDGYISLPEVHRSSRNHLITIVNGRVVRNSDLNRIINDSYHSYKPDNRYPIVVLMISVDPSLIDVNIHPTKMDIKFSKMEDLLSLVEAMIKKGIKPLTLIPNASEKPVVEYPKPHYESISLTLERVAEDTTDYQQPILVNDFNETINEPIIAEVKEEVENTEFIHDSYPY